MALRQAGQAVRHVHFQHIALQHGVVGIALHFNAVVGKDMAVVFDVLAQLFRCRVFQPRFEFGENFFAVQLLRRTGVAVGQRDIGCLARLDAKEMPTISARISSSEVVSVSSAVSSALCSLASQVSNASQVEDGVVGMGAGPRSEAGWL
jgi:hypothetical protein